ASSGGPEGEDLYSTVLHELGHALGLANNSNLAIHKRINKDLTFRFNDGTAAFLVDDPTDTDNMADHLNPAIHLNDLMNPSGRIRTRYTISDLDARILGEGFGYSIDLPSLLKRTFVTTYDSQPGSPTFRQLTIHGDLGTTLNPSRLVDQIYLNVMADEIYVDVNGYVKKFGTTAVDSIVVFGGGGSDEITVEATRAGMPLTINPGFGSDNKVFLGGGLRNLIHIQGDVTVFEEGGETTLSLRDEKNTDPRTFSIFGQDVTFLGSSAQIRYSNYGNRAQNVHRLAVRGGSGGNTFNVNTRVDEDTRTELFAGTSKDTINVSTTSVQGLTIDGVAGVDRVTIGLFERNGLRDVLGSVFVTNTNGYTDLILDDSGDFTPSNNIRVGGSTVTGVGPAALNFDPRGIQSLTVLAGKPADNTGNWISVLDTPQNRAGNLVVTLKTGQNSDRVDVEATSSSLFIDGQKGLDQVFVGKDGSILGISGTVTVSNPVNRTALTIDNSRDNRLRAGTLSEDSFRLFTTRIDFIENDLTSLTFLGGVRSNVTVNDTPQNAGGNLQTDLVFGSGIDNVNVRGTTGALNINGNGGRDNVNIGADGKVDQIAGAIDISNPAAGGFTTVNVDGSKEDIGHFVKLDSGSLRDLAPAEIRFAERDLLALTVSAGPFFNQFNVVNTPQNGPRNLSVTLNTGLVGNIVNVQQISSATTINGQDGGDIVNVGLEGNMQGITNTLEITNLLSRSTINLENSNDTRERSVTMDVVDTGSGIYGIVDFDGSEPGQIRYKQADLRALNVWAGSGLDRFSVFNTADNGVDPITTIYAGQGGDEFGVLGTTGRLFIHPQGDNNHVSIYSLDRILGDIVLEGSAELTGNSVVINDGNGTGRYVYRMDSERIYRTALDGSSPTGSIYLKSLPLASLALVAADNGNGFQIDGTPIHPASEMIRPIEVFTGAGDDHVAIFGGSHPINVAMRNGVYQTVRLGDAAHSLDAIQGTVSVSGAGFIDAFISDDASTTAKSVRIDHNVTNGQVVERRVINNQGNTVLLNTFEFDFAGQGRVSFQAGRADNGTNQVDIVGVAANSEVVASGGPDHDVFQVVLAGNTSQILGPVTINSPDADSDFAYFFDHSSLVSRDYTLKTNPLNASGFVVQSAGLPAMAFNGLVQMIFYTPQIGGNTVNIPSSPGTTLIMLLGDGDDVRLGSSSPAIAGNMSALNGAFRFNPYLQDNVISLVLDDSSNSSTARDVTIEHLGANGLVSGMGFSSLLFADTPGITLDIRGGAMDDSFIMSGNPLAARIRIDGGAGNDILVGSGGNTLFGGAGRDLLVAGGLASVLDGGLGEDILIGGSINDSSLSNLNEIRTVWTGDSAYDSRVSLLQDTRLSNDKVTGNDQRDTLTGGLDALDLFFGELENELFDGDLLTDLEESEYLVPLL
ncbi:MAG: hypothetical protein ABL921_27945, partial [Pirellula sp.]